MISMTDLRRRGGLLLPLLLLFTACEQPVAPDGDSPGPSFAKPDHAGGGGGKKGGGSTDGGHIPLVFDLQAPSSEVGVYSDGGGSYVDGEFYGGIEPVTAQLAQAGGKNAYLITYDAGRTLHYELPQAVLDEVNVRYAEFPDGGFDAPTHILLAGEAVFETLPLDSPVFYTAELQFYPTAEGMAGTMYELHYSSVKVTRTGDASWSIEPNCLWIGDQGWVDLNVRRRKSTRNVLRMECMKDNAFEYTPIWFTMTLK